ncbi:MAG: hypothetical protein ABIS06_06820 [Vicinamibacterales bacterium]
MQLAMLLAIWLAGGNPQPGQKPLDGAVGFDRRWSLDGEKTRIVADENGGTLQVESGFGQLRDVRMLNGTFDVDVRLTRRRSFVYLYFRAQADGEREEFYLRPHKSALPDAVQYAPVWQDRSAWQLHHGPGGTAAIAFADDRWTHVRIVMQGRTAALFVDDMSAPALVVPRLSREPQAGYVSLGGFLPSDVPGEGPIAVFRNVQIRPGVIPFDLAAAATRASTSAPAPAAGTGTAGTKDTIVTEWAVSRAFLVPAMAPLPVVLPGDDVAGEYRPVQAEANGLVQLHRHVKVAEGTRVSAAVARVTVHAARDTVAAFDLGFSDVATVFVNGVPVFTGDASYSFDRPRREGLIGFDQARLYLPLRAGDNQLAIIITDRFGGWGVMGRFANAPSLDISAR